MNSPPSGTVTFLFTDIEGSTKLAQQFPDEMPTLLARHNEILTQAIQNHNGYVFQIVGDSFSAAFHNVSDALNAALDSQRALHKETWSSTPIKVRMGIHTGMAQLQEESIDSRYSNYATLALSQRVMSAGHGGQVLISQSVHDLISSSIPANIKFTDMGEHHLKDVLQLQHLYQITVPDLPSEFPPLKTLKILNHNLPTNLTSFIGRERELNEIKGKLAGAHLLTLIGPGGTGKTRLSLQLGSGVLSQFPDGVWWIELAPVADQGLIVQTIAAALGLRESPGRSLLDLVTDYLRAKKMLLILDNCEHLIEGCARITDQLLHVCTQIKIVASSREALGINGETVYRVPSLYLPDQHQITREALSDCESIQLFIDRAQSANSNFQLTDENASFVAKICRRLDGIPLALELAAARVRVLSAEQIAARLDDRFRLLTGGSRTALPRQQTLQALIDWSYDLLTEPERAVFRRLAVFAGGWTLDAAEAVCAGDGIESFEVLDLLTQLVDKSLVQVNEEAGNIRYHRLETIRQYARQKLLESRETADVQERHLEYFIQLSDWANKNWLGPQQMEVNRRLRSEYDNFRTALSWAMESQPEKVLQVISWVVFIILWLYQGFISEAREWSQTAITKIENLPSPKTDEEVRWRKHLLALGWDLIAGVRMNQGEHKASKVAAKKSVAYAREIGDNKLLAQALASLGIGAIYSGEPDLALASAEEGIRISRQMGYKRELMWVYNTMTHIYNVKGDKAQARLYAEEIRALERKLGVPIEPAFEERYLSEQAFERGDKAEALKRAESALRLFEEMGDKYDRTFFLSNIAHALRAQGNFTEALNYYKKSILSWQDFGHRAAVAHQLECFAFIAIEQGQTTRAVILFSAAETLREVGKSLRTPVEQKEFAESKSKLQSQISESEFSSLWKEGQDMTMERAIEFALES